ncbi:hypothetical protein OEA41_006551 [Lepraria neglecta]|uniref:Uncharacterized protein n=1 Tax=Lepraria neglecta TaxID=209136 RepID=A0AAD9ZAJ3_9LECA|nr:hypothetical protein OEA41_006551 [Lepraria neglecta]
MHKLKWLFGDREHRTPEQKQSLKDWIATSQDDDAEDETLINYMTMVDSDGFTGWKSLEYLQKMRDRIDGDIEYFKDYTEVEMTTRTAVRMVALTMSRPRIHDP